MIKRILALSTLIFLFSVKMAYAAPLVGLVTSFIWGLVIAHPFIMAAVVLSIAYSIFSSVNAANQKNKVKNPSSRYASSVIDNIFSNEGVVPIVYGGPILMGGNIVWQSDPSTTVQRFLAICVGEVSGITDVQIDEQDIAGLPGCSYTAYYGTSTQVPDIRCAGLVKGLRDVAYLAVTLTAGDKVSGNPIVSARITGRKIKTWNKISRSWEINALSSSKNPAAIIRDYMLLSPTLGGCGLPTTFVDDDSFGEASEICDETVDNGSDGTEARYELDIIIDTQNAVLDNLSRMLSTCNMSLIRSGGVYKIAIEKVDETAVMAFTEDNISKGTFSYGYGTVDDTPNKVGVEWFSALEDKNPKRLAWAEDELDQDIHGIREQKIEAYGIIRQSQASRLAKKYLYSKKLNDIWCEFESNMSAMHCEPMDVVSVTHSRPNWTAALFRIIEINETNFGKAKYTLQAYSSSVLDDRHGSTFDDWDYGSPPNPYTAVTDVTGIVLEEIGWRNADGIHIAHINVSWTPPATKKEFLDSYIIELKKGSDDYIAISTAPASSESYRININLETDVTYYVRIKTQSIEGIISDGTVSNAIALVGKDTVPSDVSSFIVKKFRDNIICQWAKVSDVDVRRYEIRKGTSWASGGIVATNIYADELESRDIRIGVAQSYWIKAIDNSGNYSANATEAIVTVGNIPFQNIILTVLEHPTWSGTKVNTEVDGSNLKISASFLTGTYTTDVKDVGYICEARVMIQNIVSVNENLTWESDPTRAFDDSETLRFTGDETPGTTAFEIRTSEDNITWSDWEEWITADYKFRYFQIRMTVTRESLDTDLLVSNLTITADLPDVDETQDYTISVAADGAVITFVKTYHEAPSVNVDIISGDGIVHIFSVAPTITGCTIKHLALDGTAKTGDGRVHIHGI